ncbi:hypothetical protein JCM6882_005960 [Rhodosporidiobolus microsporus]
MSSQPPTAPLEVEATLARLTAHKNVQGVLILSRPAGMILRSAGTLFALPPSAARAAATAPTPGDGVEDAEKANDGEGEDGAEKLPVLNSEMALRYAKAAAGMVDAVGGEVGSLAGEGETDDLRFLRIRTRRHELMITPDDQYILIVVQDPAH